jgi:fatty acid elongase 3
MASFTPFNNDTLLKTVSAKTSGGLLSLWSGLNAVWQPVMGYKAEEFEFVQGKTAFSTAWEMGGMIVLYLVVIFGGREYMRDKKPLQLNTLFKIHNFFLSAFSGALLALFLEQLIPTLWREGFYDTICASPGWTPQLVTLYYVCLTRVTWLCSYMRSS